MASAFDVFSIVGILLILQSDNGREFPNQIIIALQQMLPEMSFVKNQRSIQRKRRKG